MTESDEDIVWFALSAPYRNEKRAQSLLEQHGVECFLPLRYRIVTDRRGEKSRELCPAVSNLLFAHTTASTIQRIKSGVKYLQYKVVSRNGKNVPLIVPDDQMNRFISVCSAQSEDLLYMTPEEVNLNKGCRVRIVGGRFDGIEGIFMRVRGSRKRRVVVLLADIAAVATAEITDGLIQVIE